MTGEASLYRVRNTEDHGRADPAPLNGQARRGRIASGRGAPKLRLPAGERRRNISQKQDVEVSFTRETRLAAVGG